MAYPQRVPEAGRREKGSKIKGAWKEEKRILSSKEQAWGCLLPEGQGDSESHRCP
jgi:hypothetical protein